MTMPRDVWVQKVAGNKEAIEVYSFDPETDRSTKYTRSDINADLVESLRNLLEWREADGKDFALLRQLEADARSALKSVGEL